MEQLTDQNGLAALAGFVGFIGFVIGLILFITFLVMAYRLGRIVRDLDDLRKLEIKKPMNRRQIKCENCGEEYNVSVLANKLKCSKCRTVNYFL